MKNKSIYIAGLAALTIASCKPNLETDAPSAGNLDFTRYVAVGNSLTAGFADGSLYRSGQENSYPVMLAGQFKMLGGGDFKVPYLPGESGWPIGNGYAPKRVLDYSTDCRGTKSLGPVLYTKFDTAGSATNVYAQGPYNNTGIPGIRAIDYVFAGYGAFNPYAGRLFSNVLAKPTDEINRADATFFSAWIGNNDVLGYATSGGSGKASGGTIFDQNAISDETGFAVAVDSVLNRMTAHGAKGVVINIPDVTAIPYFTTVPVNGLVLDTTQAAQLTAAYSPLGIKFTTGANNWIIADASAPGGLRKIQIGEYIILTVPQDSLKCAGWGSKVPIPARYVLDVKEVAIVRDATATYNQILKNGAAVRNLAYVDMNSYLKTVQTGIRFNGVDINTVFVSGGAFSLDGVHLTPKGYALVANEILRSINAYYKASIPMIDLNKYPGVKFP